MELIFLVAILALFMLPTFLMMRGQRKRQAQVEQLQASIVPGDRVVNVSGFHGTVVSTGADTLDVELAPGTVVTMERAGVMRRVEPAALLNDDHPQHLPEEN
ncbi:preprotein translocase subunit YajC [Corynebacterium sanguinis]|uniref:preprotein translocase subunit YajC n=1 Tax=Corynebacterium sanguinis TaxID=2594913 RepID=UPI0021B01DDD|nr:preprotein translocase subunit YajC [Corynebacterium sanguinis]MCT1411075.1 preprotein translocase subunit YajC [Corynebacterium sanguinis]MCT1444040.1 preprotein translocase subunit YajC [Corynebacterium sanguinis]MCT1492284.1 preprotein translocase subunit YajC [Corynebacterium sanguinis]MCT1596593.1 preprotein translocase subunit YajC [Corynebacterium sanguinis]MCT1695117.1 preprotein translocase subunit YajC [Corynebacterium sanguinis]